MKTPLSLGLMFATLAALPACSSDEGEERPIGTAGSTATAGTGGTPGAGGSSGAPAGGAGGTGGAPAASNYTAGPALVITPTPTGANVVDENGQSGISGGVILAQSTMQTPAVTAHEEGKLCWSGETATVLEMNYDMYWGAELALDLLLAPDPNAPAPAADAGADAGADVPLARQPWPIGNVVGFSFVVTGNEAGGAGVPAGIEDIRFKALPEGSDPALDTFCSQPQPTSGVAEEIALTDITWQCWAPGNPSVAEPQLNTIPMPGGTLTTRPNPNRLLSISWQVSANVNSPTPFNFCISDIKPLYAAAP